MKIHNHTILTQGKIPGHIWDQQFAWVKGYILALEDVLGDLGRQVGITDWPESAILALDIAQEKVAETLTEARATLASMEEVKDEEPGAGGPGPTAGAPDPEDQRRLSDPGAV